MNNKLKKRYLFLCFFLGVLSTAAVFYFLFYEQISAPAIIPELPVEERKPVYLNSNEIVVQKVSKNLMIDGIERALSEETPLIKYKDKIYAPLEMISKHLGKSHTEAANGIVIGNYSALEPIFFSDSIIPFSYIGSTFNREQMEQHLGEPLSEMGDPVEGETETVVRYEGATAFYSSPELDANLVRLIVHEPIMMTHRGITIGSTKVEVLKKYGEPDPESTDELWLYGETYTLWFRFEEEQVVEFGNLYIDDSQGLLNISTEETNDPTSEDNESEKEETIP